MKKWVVSLGVLFLLFQVVFAQETFDPGQCGALSYRGDMNGDQTVDLSDSVALLKYLFQGGSLVCNYNSDINWDGKTDLTDAIYLLNFLFQGGNQPAQLDHGLIDDPVELAFDFKPLIDGSEVTQMEVGGILEIEANLPQVLVVVDLGGDDDIQECSGNIVGVDSNNQPLGNREPIFQSSWKEDSSFTGNNLLRYPLEILIEKVPAERSQILFSCSDGKSSSSISFILKRSSLQNLDFNENKRDIQLLQVPNPGVSGPTACCEITCRSGDNSQFKTCEQTIETDCDSWAEDWTKYGYTAPSDLCAAISPGSILDAKPEYHSDKACNKDVSPPVCGGPCQVDKMTIFKGGDTVPSEINLPPVLKVQTVGTPRSLGHAEGWDTDTKSLTGEILSTPENSYKIGYRFLPYAKVIGDPSTCYTGQFIKFTLVTNVQLRLGSIPPYGGEPLPGGVLGIELIRLYTGVKIPDLMFSKTQLVKEKKLSELPLLAYEPPTKIYEKRVPWMSSSEAALGSLGVCLYTGDTFCGDDYIKPPGVMKKADGSLGKIAWHDYPYVPITLDKIMSVGPISGGSPFPSSSGALFRSEFDERMDSFISIVENSNERERYVCYLSIHLANNVRTTGVPKALLLDDKCHCEQQQRVSGKWETVTGKDNLACGQAGLA